MHVPFRASASWNALRFDVFMGAAGFVVWQVEQAWWAVFMATPGLVP